VSLEYGVNNMSGFLWQGIVNVFSGPEYGLTIIGLLGLMFVLGVLYVRGADFGLILLAVMLFSMFAVLYGLLPLFVLYTVYLIAGGIVVYAILKIAGGR